MLSTEEIRKALDGLPLTVVAFAAKVNRTTLSRLRNGHHVNMTEATRRKLSLYLQGKKNDR